MKMKHFRRMLSVLLAVAMLCTMIPAISASATAVDPASFGNAHWIWSSVEGDVDPETGLASTGDVWMNFRRDFTLEEVPSEAPVKIAADSKYWMWINGEEVVWEGSVVRGPNATDTYFDSLDIAEYLREGKNTIAIQVWYWGQRGNGYKASGSGGLLFHSDLMDASNGNQAVESGDGKWMALKNAANVPSSVSPVAAAPNVRFDAQLAIDWITPLEMDYTGWNVARNIGSVEDADQGKAGCAPWNGLWERPIPFWKDYGSTIVDFEEVEQVTGAPDQSFTQKTLADAGRVGTEPYSISADFQMTGMGDVDSNVYNGIYYIFGATSKATTDFYQAFIDFSSFLHGENTPTMTVTRGDAENDPILKVDLSSIINVDNYKLAHNFKIDVVSANKIDYYLDGKLLGTTNNIDATMEDATFGFKIAGVSSNRLLRPLTKAEVTNLSVMAGDKVLCDSSDLANIDTTPTYDDYRGYTIKEGTYYPLVATKDIPAYLYGENTYSTKKYRITLPHSGQIVPYLKLGEGTEAGKEILMWTNTYFYGNSRTEYITAQGAQEYEAKNWINGDQLFFVVPDGVEIEQLGYRETGYQVTTGEEIGQDTDFIGYFDSVVDMDDYSVSKFTGGQTWSEEEASLDNNFYDEIWKKSVRTAYETIRDSYMDCASRERGQYIGDAVNEIEEAFYSMGPELNDVSRNAVYNIVDWQYAVEGTNGREYDYYTSNVRPSNMTQEIIVQSLSTSLAAWNLWLFTGDEEIPAYTWQRLYNILTMHDMEEEGPYAGLVKIRNNTMGGWGSGWLDWGENQDTLLSHNVWWYASAQAVRKLADAEGSGATQQQKDWIDARMKSIEENFYKFWNEDLQAYATEWSKSNWTNAKALEDNSHLVDDRMNAMAVIFGLVPEEKYPQMLDVFMGTETAPAYENASVYMEKYVLQAMYMMGYDEEAMIRMARRQMDAVNEKDISTMPELLNYLTNSSSVGHGWSGGAMISLSRYAAGIEPTEAGYAAWHVIPQMGSFTSIETRVPSEIGNIDVTLVKDEEADTFDMTVVSPGGNAEIWVPVNDVNMTTMQTAGEEAEYLGIKEAYQKQYAVYAVSEAGAYSFTAKSGCVLSATAPESAQVNADFVVSIVTDAATSDVKLFNEAGMALSRKDVKITDNGDGTKTFDITISVGTVGEGRTFKVVTKGNGSYDQDSGTTVSLDITSIPANITSFDVPESTVANRTFIVTATTDLSATKIEVFNETGMKMGLRSLTSKVVDGQKEWTGVMSIGTQGERTFTAYAVNKYGARSEALTDNISVKAFA